MPRQLDSDPDYPGDVGRRGTARSADTRELAPSQNRQPQEQFGNAMPFSLYMIGFLVFMAGVVWAAVVVGVPQLYITLGVLALIAVGAVVAFARSRMRRPDQRMR